MPRKRAMFWKVRAMPSLVRREGASLIISSPLKRMFPRCGR